MNFLWGDKSIKRISYFYLFIIAILFVCMLFFTFFNQIFFGSYTVYSSDAITFIYRSKLYVTNGAIYDNSLYPPGIPILFGILNLVGIGTILSTHLIRFVYSLLFIIITFMLAKKMLNTNYALCVMVFVAFPITVWSNRPSITNEFFYTFLLQNYPYFSGSSLDYFIIILNLYFIFNLLSTKNSKILPYSVCLMLSLITFGFMHISRWIAFCATLIIFSLILIILHKSENKNITNYFAMFLCGIISIIIVILSIYGWRLNDVFKLKELSFLFNSFNITFIIIAILILSVSLLIIYFSKERLIDSSIIKTKSVFWIFIILMSFTLIIVNVNINKYLIVSGPFYVGNFFNFQVTGYYTTIFNTGFSMIILSCYIVGTYIMLRNQIEIIKFYIISLIVYDIALIFNFHVWRMNLDDYYRPFLLGIILYAIVAKNTQIPLWIKNSILSTKKLTTIMIAFLISSQIAAVTLEVTNEEQSIPETQVNYIPFLKLSPPSKILTTYEFLNTVMIYTNNDPHPFSTYPELLVAYTNKQIANITNPPDYYYTKKYVDTYFNKIPTSKYIIIFSSTDMDRLSLDVLFENNYIIFNDNLHQTIYLHS